MADGMPPWFPRGGPRPLDIYAHIVRHCPHEGCEWETVEEYRSSSHLAWRMTAPPKELEKLVLEHLESHLDPTLKDLNL